MRQQAVRALQLHGLIAMLFFTCWHNRQNDFALTILYNLYWYIPVFYLLGLYREIAKEIQSL